MSDEAMAVILSASDTAASDPPTGEDVLRVLLWMFALGAVVFYGIGVWAFSEAMRGEVLLTEPDRSVARWAIGLWWPVFAFFRFVEWVAHRWRTKEWP